VVLNRPAIDKNKENCVREERKYTSFSLMIVACCSRIGKSAEIQLRFMKNLLFIRMDFPTNFSLASFWQNTAIFGCSM